MPTHLSVHTPEQVRSALRAAADGERRILDALTYGRTAPYLVVWGAVWAFGFIGTGLGLGPAEGIWGITVAAGWTATVLMVRRRAAKPFAESVTAWRYAASAAILSIHAVLWVVVLSSQQPNALGVYAGSVTGCASAIAGLWRGRLILALGLAITALFLAGLLLPPSAFSIYAGLLGGGGLVAAGLLLAWLDPT